MRVSWIDMAKGYGIIFVIAGHIGLGILGDWIYTFHIPLFFLLSGYVFHDNGKFHDFLKKKTRSILIPYFILGIPIMLWSFFRAGYYSWEDLFFQFKLMIVQRRYCSLWFLACLFILNILFFFLKKYLKKDYLLLAISIVSPIFGLCYYRNGGSVLPWNIDVVMMALPFFTGGYFIKKFKGQIQNYLCRKNEIILFVLLATGNILGGYWSRKISGTGLEMFASLYGYPPLTYFAAFCGSICTILVSRWCPIEPIRYIGENSIVYYAWHQCILPVVELMLTGLRITSDQISNGVIIRSGKVLELIITLFILTLINMLISRTKLAHLL